MIGDGEVVAASPMSKGTGKPTLADTAWSRDQKIVVRSDPIAGSKLEEEGTVEAADGTVVNVLDAGVVAQLGGFCPGLEPLLLA